MQNSKTNPANPASQPTEPHPPVVPGPINWLELIECSFKQLRDVTAAAQRAGYRAVRLHVIRGGYRVEFQRLSKRIKGISLNLRSSKDSWYF